MNTPTTATTGTVCNPELFKFPAVKKRVVAASFSGGEVTSDGGLPLLRQRIYGLCHDYEDLNDHDPLRLDPVWQTAVEQIKPLASSPTLCRLRRAGVPREAAMRLVNHSSELIHQIYQRERVEDVAQWRDAVQFPS